jgi:hypothetical protein
MVLRISGERQKEHARKHCAKNEATIVHGTSKSSGFTAATKAPTSI